MLSYLAKNKYFRLWFGDFDVDELKKYVRLGIIFALVIGVYWTLRPIKDSIFMAMVYDPIEAAKNSSARGAYIPWAKIASLIILFPLVILYSKAVERFPRQKMFYFLGSLYFIATVFFALYFMYSPNGLSNKVGSVWRLAGWAWYIFVESYGSLMVALFWSFATDTSSPESAKRGFSITVMFGQIGAILGPWLLVPLGKKYFANSAPVIFICAILISLVVLGIFYFMKVTPKSQLTGFHGKNEAEEEKEQEPGFFEGLKLMLSNMYLLGIFGIIAIYEILVTIIDYNFKSAVGACNLTEAECARYLGDYAVYVNLVSFLCLFFGISNIQRYLGIKVSLVIMPFLLMGMMMLFLFFGNLSVLFWIMVTVKAINYALNGPTMKQLYVPTTKDVKYKSQAWIETFGSRGSKASGSGFNIISKKLGSYFGLFLRSLSIALGLLWVIIAIFIANKYQKAIKENKVVC